MVRDGQVEEDEAEDDGEFAVVLDRVKAAGRPHTGRRQCAMK
jgi:hypothetical protein